MLLTPFQFENAVWTAQTETFGNNDADTSVTCPSLIRHTHIMGPVIGRKQTTFPPFAIAVLPLEYFLQTRQPTLRFLFVTCFLTFLNVAKTLDWTEISNSVACGLSLSSHHKSAPHHDGLICIFIELLHLMPISLDLVTVRYLDSPRASQPPV